MRKSTVKTVMSKYKPFGGKSVPIGTVAPISKKPAAGSAGKGAGIVAKSGKSGPFGSGGKGSNVFGSNAKSGKSSAPFDSSGKSSTFGIAKTSSSNANAKTASFIPFGSSKKVDVPLGPSDKKPTVPLLLGGKSTSAFASNPSKSYPSTSFSSAKKPGTSFGILWIPGRKRNKKKEYVHVSHRDDGYRSPSMYHYDHNLMSGDSSSHQPFKKKEEESNLLVLDGPKPPIAAATSAAVVMSAAEKPAHENVDPFNIEDKEKQEKQELFKPEKDEGKDAAGDARPHEEKDAFGNLDNNTDSDKPEKNLHDRGDNVDSVYLRPPPPHKVRSNTSTADDEDCGIKCLYYTLQCCDCVLM